MFELPPEPPKFWLPAKPAIIRQATPDLVALQRQPLVRSRRRAGAAPKIVTIVAAQSVATGESVSNFSVDWGAADPTKIMILAIASRSSTSGQTSVTGVTIDGVAASLAIESDQTTAPDSSIWALASATGGSLAVVVTGNTRAQTVIQPCYITGGEGITATPFHTGTQRTSGNPSVLLNVPDKGFVVAAVADESSADHVWTGTTELFDSNLGTSRSYSTAGQSDLPAETGRTVSVVGSGGNKSMVAASW